MTDPYHFTEKTTEGWAVFAVLGYTVYRATDFYEKEREAIAAWERNRLGNLKELTPEEIDCYLELAEYEEFDLYQDITLH